MSQSLDFSQVQKCVECRTVIVAHRDSMWPGAGFLYSVAVLLIAACYWIAYHTSEGILQKELVGTQRGDAPFSQRGDVLVALRDAPPVRRALLSGCHSIDVLPAPASTLLASGLLAYVQIGRASCRER